jgi:peptide/nickel transport system substrate-binding protein
VLSFLAAVASVEVLDDRTALFHTRGPYAPLDRRFSAIPIVPAKLIQRIGDEAFQRRPVGSGPFRFVELVRDSHLKLEANEAYWGGAPRLGELVYRFIPDESTRVAALLAGQVDVINNLPPERIPEVEGRKELRVASVTGLTTQYISINTNVKPLDDVRVRQALNYAVNVDAIINDLLLGNARRSSQPLQPGVLGYDPSITPFPYDPARARQLLTEAGYQNGFSVVLDTYEGRFVKDKEVMQAVAADLQKIGIRVEQHASTWTNAFSRYLKTELNGLFMTAVLNPLIDPDHPLPLAFGTGNTRYYVRPEIEAEISRTASLMQPGERNAAVQSLVRKLVDDAPWIFLYDLNDLFGVSQRVNWEPRGDNRIVFTDASIKS